MIIEYNRPTTLEEALSLLARSEPRSVPLGGGSNLTCMPSGPVAAVDLQALELDSIVKRGDYLDLGATLTLQKMLGIEGLPQALTQAVQLEATYNLRQVATVAGSLVAADGRSPFALVMLALDASLTLAVKSTTEPEYITHSLGDFLPLREERLSHRLITLVTIPLNVDLYYEYVARSPADRPIVAVAVAIWPSGRTRVALGGYGACPALTFDGTETSGAEIAAQNAYSHAGDAWASAEYRSSVAGVLVKRILDK